MPSEIPTIDERIVQVGIEIKGRLKVYEGLQIHATGTKYANPIMNEANIRIANLSREDREYILTESSPFNRHRTRKLIKLWAGRKSTGVQQIFSGDIVNATPSQPPDITLSIQARTGFFVRGLLITSTEAPVSSMLNASAGLAQQLGVPLQFEATDKNIANYNYAGTVGGQIDHLSQQGNYDVYQDDNAFVVKDRGKPLVNNVHVLSEENGMIGIPQITDFGVKVKYLIDRTTRPGSQIIIQSQLNPATSGPGTVYKLGFDIASRETPFYWIAECLRYRPLPAPII